jgi:hypothetical protein
MRHKVYAVLTWQRAPSPWRKQRSISTRPKCTPLRRTQAEQNDTRRAYHKNIVIPSLHRRVSICSNPAIASTSSSNPLSPFFPTSTPPALRPTPCSCASQHMHSQCSGQGRSIAGVYARERLTSRPLHSRKCLPSAPVIRRERAVWCSFARMRWRVCIVVVPPCSESFWSKSMSSKQIKTVHCFTR